MNQSTYILVLLYSVVVSAIGFQGQISGIPQQINELYREKNIAIVNGDNYQTRIKVDLYNLNSEQATSALVKSDYSFEFKELTTGEYELLVNSYDFEFYNNRFRIIISDEIYAYEDRIGESTYNQTSQINLSKTPLKIIYKTTKLFYENPQGSIGDWFSNGPFGFIFRNRVYTIIFTVMMGLSLAPYVLKWISPELAKELEDMKVEAAKERLEKVTPPVADPPQGTIRKRK